MMKKNSVLSLLIPVFLIFGLFFLSLPASCQATLTDVPTIPEGVNKIIIASCTPCHTSNGGLMSRSKLNFSEWTKYSPEKQKERAAKMYSELNKGAMPPKSARAKRPDLIPTKEQIETIKQWSESFPAEKK
jgi:hypothetical protein